MKINIIAIGKLKKHFKELFDDYKKKTQFYCEINVFELKECSDKNFKVQKLKETKEILNIIPKNSHVILCSLQGKEYNSKEFVEIIDKDNITFVIGGSHGVDENMFEHKIRFSKMTFPHQLFRVFLMEQIFRSFAIKNNSKYHK